jgi:hypothetical protein
LIALGGGHSAVGDPDEGMILLPVSALPLAPLLKGGPQSTVASPSPTPQLMTRSRGQQGATVRIGYVNRNQQEVIEATGLPGTDHGQSIYVLRCGRCGTEYGNNGSGNAQRKCPRCQGGGRAFRSGSDLQLPPMMRTARGAGGTTSTPEAKGGHRRTPRPSVNCPLSLGRRGRQCWYGLDRRPEEQPETGAQACRGSRSIRSSFRARGATAAGPES